MNKVMRDGKLIVLGGLLENNESISFLLKPTFERSFLSSQEFFRNSDGMQIMKISILTDAWIIEGTRSHVMMDVQSRIWPWAG